MKILKRIVLCKYLALFLAFVLMSGDVSVYSQQADYQSHFAQAVRDYKAGDFQATADRLVRLLEFVGEAETEFTGRVYLLLGAANEKLDNRAAARARYKKANTLLKDPVIDGLELNDLPYYCRVFNIEAPAEEKKVTKNIWTESGKDSKSSRNVITREGKKKKKKFPILLVVLGVAAVAAAVVLLGGKKKSSPPQKCTLNVDLADGVNGLPGQGSHSYNQGDQVQYNYSLQDGYKDLVVKLDGSPVSSSGTVTMNANHTLTVTAASQEEYTLNVTLSAGVNGTPKNGSHTYKEGKTVSYSYSLQSGYQNLEVKLDGKKVSASGTVTMNSNHSLSVSATSTSHEFILTVNLGEGVKGTPAEGSYAHDKGDQVSYTYSLLNGYEDLAVKLDGNQVAASGTVTMNANHTLAVMANKSSTGSNPDVNITNPGAGDTVSGTVHIVAQATDDVSVSYVKLYIDNVFENTYNCTSGGTERTVDWYWNSTSVSDGDHTIKTVVYDNSGNTGVDSIAIKVKNSSETGVITVTNPSSGASWVRGTTETIRWTSSGTVEDVQIQLQDSLGYYTTIVSSTANDGSYAWAIPANGEIGSGFKIRISDVNHYTAIHDFSGSFSITSGGPTGEITVTNPSSGASWVRGTTETIRWTSSGTVGNVTIQLQDSSGLYTTIVSSTSNDGSYIWAIPSSGSVGSGFKIRVSDVNHWPSIYDFSGSFSIQ